MLIVVDGVNGSGKTTLCKALAHELPQYTHYKPLRDPNTHTDWDGRLKELAKIVPINTVHEDFLALDIGHRIGANLILDRSVPAGVAYDEILKKGLGPGEITDWLWRHGAAFYQWVTMMIEFKAVSVFLVCGHEAAVSRCTHTTFPHTRRQQNTLVTAYTAMHQEALGQGVRSLIVRTDKLDQAAVLGQVLEFIERPKPDGSSAEKGDTCGYNCACARSGKAGHRQ